MLFLSKILLYYIVYIFVIVRLKMSKIIKISKNVDSVTIHGIWVMTDKSLLTSQFFH